MKYIITLCLLVLLIGCGGKPRDTFGQVMFSSKSIYDLRMASSAASKDKGADMATRINSFTALVHSFSPGTSEGELGNFLNWDTKASIGGDSHSLHLITPDGSHFWITIKDGKIADD